MAKEAAADTLEELAFPLHGLNLIKEFEAQPQGTTPVGTNVRAYETLTQRNRGGSRPGLAEYINSSVLGFPSKIQHLNIIVDPTTNALLIDDDTGTDTIEDPSTNNLSIRNPVPHRRIRRGGSARQPNRHKKTAPAKLTPVITQVKPNVGNPSGGDSITITGQNLLNTSNPNPSTCKFGLAGNASIFSNDGTTMVVTSPALPGGNTPPVTVDIRITVPAGGNLGGTTPITAADQFTYGVISRVQSTGQANGTFFSPVTQGNLIVVFVEAINGTTTGVSDTANNSYTLIGTSPAQTGFNGAVYKATMWYAIANATGNVTVSASGSGTSLGPCIEYTKGSPFVSPLDSDKIAGASPNTGSTTADLGTVPVTAAAELVVAIFYGDYIFSGTGIQADGSFEFTPVSADQDVSASGTGANPFLGAAWVSVGASFKQA